MNTRTRARAASAEERRTHKDRAAPAAHDALAQLRQDFMDLCAEANDCGLAYVVRTHWMSAFDEPYRADDAPRCRAVLEMLQARVDDAKTPPAERERRAKDGWRRTQEAAELRSETARWIARGPRDILEEIEQRGERRVFLTKAGAIAVRGCAIAEHLKAALLHHERVVRLILADRETVAEIAPAPSAAKAR